jgi:hypothetical protein
VNKRQQKKAIIKYLGRKAYRRMTVSGGYITLRPIPNDEQRQVIAMH